MPEGMPFIEETPVPPLCYRSILSPLLLAIMLVAAKPVPAQPKPAAPVVPRSGEQVYRETCFACHETGVARAPRIGDRAGWAARIDEGLPMLASHGWVGVQAMPPKGGNPDLSLGEFASGVVYMANQSGASWKEPDAPTLRRILKETERRLELTIREAEAMKRDLRRQREALR